MLRERLNSDGLHSPVEEDFTIETHLPSPSCTALYATHSFTHTLLFLNTYLDTSFISRSRSQHIHNIAEELDPTFKARKCESQISTNPPSGKSADFVKKNLINCDIRSQICSVFSTDVCLAPRNPHSIFYDYLPEPNFVPPTKRQNDKAARHKTKDKRENCKQQ